ncbi:MAG: HmuY family protein [Bacteroidia bacterium]
MQSLNSLFIISLILLASCMPGEEAVEPFPRGEVKEAFIDAGSEKNTIVFYDLERDSVVARTSPEAWDVHLWEGKLYINFFRSLKVAPFVGDLLSRTDTQNLNFQHLQLADNQWQFVADSNYIIDMGLKTNGSHMGFYKFKFILNGAEAQLDFAELSSSSLERKLISDGDYFSIINQSFTVLPKEDEYDLSFGKYTHYFPVEDINYEVYGAVSLNAQLAKTNTTFSNINSSMADTISWSSYYDAIGYDWKYYSLEKGAYEIDDQANYLIKNRSGFIYKMRFTNFYNSIGTSGHPSFEYELL